MNSLNTQLKTAITQLVGLKKNETTISYCLLYSLVFIAIALFYLLTIRTGYKWLCQRNLLQK